MLSSIIFFFIREIHGHYNFLSWKEKPEEKVVLVCKIKWLMSAGKVMIMIMVDVLAFQYQEC